MGKPDEVGIQPLLFCLKYSIELPIQLMTENNHVNIKFKLPVLSRYGLKRTAT
jgi:hypothetical protein